MRVDVIGKHLDVTDAIRTYAENKAEKLTRYLDMTQHISVVLEGHKKSEFSAEVVVDVEHHDDFISHAKAEDLYAAIDLAVDKSARQLTDFKEKLKSNKR